MGANGYLPVYCGTSLQGQLAHLKRAARSTRPEEYDPGAEEEIEEARRQKRHMDELRADFGGGDD